MEDNLFNFSEESDVKISASLVHKENIVKQDDCLVEAIQIIRITNGVMGKRRDILDTIKVEGAKMTYERALRVAKYKAKMLGNCMVIEKLERIVQSY